MARVISFTLTGRITAKKNNRNLFRGKGKVFNLPSNKYKQWHARASSELKVQNVPSVKNVTEVQMEFYMPDNLRTDLTNKVESIMDLLVDNGIIIDDCWQQIPRILIDCKGIDRENPRVDVWVQSNE